MLLCLLHSFKFKVYLVHHSAISFLCKLLLEQSAVLRLKLLRSSWFRIIFGTMILSCLVLTNSHRGKVASDLSKPIPAAQIVTIKEAVEQEFSILENTPRGVRSIVTFRGKPANADDASVKNEIFNYSKLFHTFLLAIDPTPDKSMSNETMQKLQQIPLKPPVQRFAELFRGNSTCKV